MFYDLHKSFTSWSREKKVEEAFEFSFLNSGHVSVKFPSFFTSPNFGVYVVWLWIRFLLALEIYYISKKNGLLKA